MMITVAAPLTKAKISLSSWPGSTYMRLCTSQPPPQASAGLLHCCGPQPPWAAAAAITVAKRYLPLPAASCSQIAPGPGPADTRAERCMCDV